MFWSRVPDGYRKNDRKRAVVWPWLVLELSTVLALTQLGIRQPDWWRAGIRSTNLHSGRITDHTWFLLPRPASLETHDNFLHFAYWCMRAAVAGRVHSGSVVVLSDICYSDHWWLESYLYDLRPLHVELHIWTNSIPLTSGYWDAVDSWYYALRNIAHTLDIPRLFFSLMQYSSFHLVIFSTVVCLKWLCHHSFSVALYRHMESLVFVSITIVQSMKCANDWVYYSLLGNFLSLPFRLSYRRSYADLLESIKHINACQLYSVECVSKIRSIIGIIIYAIHAYGVYLV